MSQKSRDVVIFDGNGKELDWSPTIPPSEKKKYGKDPDATELIEVLVVKDGRLKSEWHKMFTQVQFFGVVIALIIIMFLVYVGNKNYQQKLNHEYAVEMKRREICGCSEFRPEIHREGKNKDEGCRPQCLAP